MTEPISKTRGVSFLKAQAKAKKVSLTEVAEAVGMPDSTFRVSMKRGRFPSGSLKEIASFLGLSFEQLKEAGLEETEPRVSRRFPKHNQNVMPLIKNIAQSGLTELSTAQFDFLIRTGSQFPIEMSPVLIREVITHRFLKS